MGTGPARNADIDKYSHSDEHAYRYTYRYANQRTYRYADTNCHLYVYRDLYRNVYANTDSHTDGHLNAFANFGTTINTLILAPCSGQYPGRRGCCYHSLEMLSQRQASPLSFRRSGPPFSH